MRFGTEQAILQQKHVVAQFNQSQDRLQHADIRLGSGHDQPRSLELCQGIHDPGFAADRVGLLGGCHGGGRQEGLQSIVQVSFSIDWFFQGCEHGKLEPFADDQQLFETGQHRFGGTVHVLDKLRLHVDQYDRQIARACQVTLRDVCRVHEVDRTGSTFSECSLPTT